MTISYLYLVKSPGKNYGIELLSNDVEKIEQFKHRCYRMPRSLNWFHQGDDTQWQFFEFWSVQEMLFLTEAMVIAEELGMELHLDHPPREVVMNVIARGR